MQITADKFNRVMAKLELIADPVDRALAMAVMTDLQGQIYREESAERRKRFGWKPDDRTPEDHGAENCEKLAKHFYAEWVKLK